MINNKLTLQFNINHQELTRTDGEVLVEKSYNYVYAHFIFSDDWDNLQKKVIVYNLVDEMPYECNINSKNICKLPNALIEYPGFVFSVVGENNNVRITTEQICVDVDDNQFTQGEEPLIDTITSDTLKVEKDTDIVNIELDLQLENNDKTISLKSKVNNETLAQTTLSNLVNTTELTNSVGAETLARIEADTLLNEEKQDKLISGTNIKTVNNESVLGSGNISIKTYHTFSNSWSLYGTTEQFCDSIVNDSSAVAGMTYLGTLHCSDLPGGLVQGEATVEIISEGANGKAIHISMTSVNRAPYRWEYERAKVNGSYTTPDWQAYQLELVSGTNIKTINGNSLLGSGNLVIDSTDDRIGYIPSVINAVYEQGSLVGYTFDSRYFGEFQKEVCYICLGQAFGNALFYSTIGKDTNASQSITSRTFYSLGTNYGTTYDPTTSSSYTRLFRYKLVYSYYNTTLTYSEEEMMQVENSLSNPTWAGHPATVSAINNALSDKQNTLVSGTNIKTINNESVLGSGNINTKELPSYPSDASTKTYSLKLINGTLTWIEE